VACHTRKGYNVSRRVYVTSTGRAISAGRVTRSSLYVKRPKGKPLPAYLACHPKALTRTKRHPGCLTYQPTYGKMVGYLRELAGNSVGFSTGEGLDHKGPIALYVQGFGTFQHNDLIEAVGWAKAAREFGYKVEVRT
jgi:hypothetical protein